MSIRGHPLVLVLFVICIALAANPDGITADAWAIDNPAATLHGGRTSLKVSGLAGVVPLADLLGRKLPMTDMMNKSEFLVAKGNTMFNHGSFANIQSQPATAGKCLLLLDNAMLARNDPTSDPTPK